MKKSLKIIASILLIASMTACGGGSSSSTPTPTWETTSGSDAITTLQVADTTVGTGATAVAGDTLTVNYTGWLYQAGAVNSEGPEFDSTSTTGTPFSFPLGQGQVIAGFDQGLVGMKVGGTRTLIIPSQLGYGPNGQGPIPGGAALVFSVQLLSITPPVQ